MEDHYFDKILSERIQFGYFQKQAFFLLGMINFNDGAEFINTSLLAPILEKRWNLDKSTTALFGGLFAFGMFFGALCMGKISHILGRRRLILITCIIQIFLIIFTSISTHPTEIAVIRFLYGAIINLNLPLSYNIISEIVPYDLRGRANIVPVFFELVGHLYSIFWGFIFLKSVDTGNWRALVFTTMFPNIFVFIASLKYLLESPRFLMHKRQFEDAFQNLDKMGQMNQQNYQPLSNYEKIQLQKYQNEQEGNYGDFKGLFKQEYFSITMRLMIIRLILNFTLAGLGFLLPFYFINDSNSLLNFLKSLLGEFPSLIVVYYTIDNKNFGRTQSILFGFLFQAFSYFLVVLHLKNIVLGKIFIQGTFLSSFFLRIVLQNMNALGSESYDTKYRDVGAGWTMGITRVSGAIAPPFMYYLFLKNPKYPMALLAFLDIIGMITIWKFPKDLTLKPMK